MVLFCHFKIIDLSNKLIAIYFFLSCGQCKIANIILELDKHDINIHVGLLIQEGLIILGLRLA